MLTGTTRTVDLPVTAEQMALWATGRPLLQDCFPDLAPDQREFIKTGITAEEWRDAIGDDSDE